MKGYTLSILALVSLAGGLVGCSSDYDKNAKTPATTDSLSDAKGVTSLCSDLLHSLGPDAALDICTQEAKSGNSNAQATLGNLYLDGTLGKSDWTKAMPWLLLAAEQGHMDAKMQVAQSFQLGRGLAKDDEQAFLWYKQAAEGEHAPAQLALARCYQQGTGTPKDEAMAIKWLSKCAKSGDSEAMYQLALLYQTLDPEQAHSTLMMAAQNQHALAMFTLGKIYQEGKNVAKDDSKALYWYSQAISQNNPEAQYEVAIMLLNNEWQMKENPLMLLRQSALQNHTPSQILLAKIYAQGQHVAKDDSIALEWYQAAAKQSDPEAHYQIGLCYLNGLLSQPKNFDLGVDYLKQAALHGHMGAQFDLARLYLEGNAVLVDREHAMEYLTKAANAGFLEAQIKLADVLMQFSLPQHDKSAFQWLQKAALNEHIEAQYRLANFYYEGIGTGVDYEQALKIYQTLASRDHYLSHFKLGQMYFHGHGVEQNEELAKKWLVSAARHDVSEAQHWIEVYLKESYQSLVQEQADADLTNWLQTKSTKKDAEALFQQGMNYLYGKQGFEQNVETGVEFLMLAAEKDFPSAQRELAIIYERGLFGYQASENVAYDWYKKAAKNKDNYAQFCLAKMYYNGKGVAKDYIQSYAFASLSAEQGKEEAIKFCEQLAEQLNPNELAVAKMIAANRDAQTGG